MMVFQAEKVSASLPLRERGLKFYLNHYLHKTKSVAPLAGAWIEISNREYNWFRSWVAPLAGAWIEISSKKWYKKYSRVAPLAGAWIEINHLVNITRMIKGRSPSGSVD